jgi:hypothetical protein
VLPVVFNGEWVFAYKIVGEFFNSAPSAFGFAFERGFSPADNAGVCGDFDEAHSFAGVELFYFGNFHGDVLL